MGELHVRKGEAMEKFYISDHDGGPVQLQISGRIASLAGDKICLVNSDFDIERFGELINACGYTAQSLVGRRITVLIEDEL